MLMKSKIHRITGIVALMCIITFFSSTLLVELFGTKEWIAKVKGFIVCPGLFILIPAIIAAGGTGAFLAKKRKGVLVDQKKKRMPFIGANGVLILIPAAIYLSHLAAAGIFDAKFYAVQGLELLAGAINMTLMSMNIRDGFRMNRNFK